MNNKAIAAIDTHIGSRSQLRVDDIVCHWHKREVFGCRCTHVSRSRRTASFSVL